MTHPAATSTPHPQRADDAALLTHAVDLASANAATGQLPFGALVVSHGVVVATGVNTALRDLDPLAHAEVAAVRNACRHLGTLILPGVTVVSSCEPCPMCHAVAAAAGVARILYAAPKESVPDLGDEMPAGHLDVVSCMRDALRAAIPDQVIHVPTPGAEQPFVRYLAGRS